MCDLRKSLRRVKSRPEIEIADKRFAFSSQTSPIDLEPSYKTGPKQVKMSISSIAQSFLEIFRVQHVHVALTVRLNFRKFSPAWRARGARAWEKLYNNSFSGSPGSDECQCRKWPLAHERPRVTKKFPRAMVSYIKSCVSS